MRLAPAAPPRTPLGGGLQRAPDPRLVVSYLFRPDQSYIACYGPIGSQIGHVPIRSGAAVSRNPTSIVVQAIGYLCLFYGLHRDSGMHAQ